MDVFVLYCLQAAVMSIKLNKPYMKVFTGKYLHVWLIQFNAHDSSLKAIKDKYVHNSPGSYLFDGLVAGTYYTKAAVYADTSSNLYKHFMPTYHDSALKWKDAAAIT